MVYDIREDVPPPADGLVASIRKMKYGDSIIIPATQHLGVHTCARSIGARVKTRSNKDGTVTVWRVDEPQPQPDTDIFGNPWPQVPATGPGPLNPLSQPETKDIFE